MDLMKNLVTIPLVEEGNSRTVLGGYKIFYDWILAKSYHQYIIAIGKMKKAIIYSMGGSYIEY